MKYLSVYDDSPEFLASPVFCIKGKGKKNVLESISWDEK